MSDIDPTSYQTLPTNDDETGWGDNMLTALWTKGTALVPGVGALRGLVTAVQRFFVDPTDFGNPLAEIKFQQKYTVDATGVPIVNEATERYKSLKSSDSTVNITDDGNSIDLKILIGQKKLYNPTGTTIPSGTVLHLASAGTFEGETYPVFEYARADKFETCQGSLVFASGDVAPNSTGDFEFSAPKIAADTSSLNPIINPEDAQIWLSQTVAGAFTNIEPTGQGFKISVGGAYSVAVDGDIWANITTTTEDVTNEYFIGTIVETFDFTVSSTDGINVVGLLANRDEPTRDLTMILPRLKTLDTTTTPLTIPLSAGTDDNEQKNYIYIPESTLTLTVSTVGWPAENHCRIAECDIQSAANVQAVGGARGNQNWNDHLKKKNGNGHGLHYGNWIRHQPATHISGTVGTFDATGGNGYISITSGVVLQGHEHVFDAISMPTRDVIVDNDPDITNREIDNLNLISKFSDGSTWSNKWGKIVVYLVANKSGEPSFMHVNLPSEGFTSAALALENDSKANYGVPKKYKGKAILIAAFAIKITGGVVEYTGSYQDLRDVTPNSTSGGSSGGGVTSLLALDDVSPSSFVGQAGKSLVVAAGETTTEFQPMLARDGSNADSDVDLENYCLTANCLNAYGSDFTLAVLHRAIGAATAASILFKDDVGEIGNFYFHGGNNNSFIVNCLNAARTVATIRMTVDGYTGDTTITGDYYANNTELVLTENIVADLDMQGFKLLDVDSIAADSLTISISQVATGVSNNTFFRDSGRSDKLSYKGVAGVITEIEA
jgi:hypothetical protein